jgi:putative oxidoreductase
MSLLNKLTPIACQAWRGEHLGAKALNALRDPWLLMSRVYVGNVFFKSGLTKIDDWSSTVALFADEYKVPFLSPEVAAVAGTTGELVLPILLVLGGGGRFAALGLSVINVVAVLSLPDIAPAALQKHVFWGWLLATLAIVGIGRWAVDHWLKSKALRSEPI